MEQIDLFLFEHINTAQSNSFFDVICPILRYPKTWIPFYVFMGLMAIIQYKKRAWLWIVFAILCITLTDQISSQWLKYLFDRPRPCHLSDLTNVILRVDRCPDNASFPSSHAVNHMGIAVFFAITLKETLKKYKYLLYFWAFSIAYAQVYVGVHYPVDVIGGLIIGTILGLIPSVLFKILTRA